MLLYDVVSVLALAVCAKWRVGVLLVGMTGLFSLVSCFVHKVVGSELVCWGSIEVIRDSFVHVMQLLF